MNKQRVKAFTILEVTITMLIAAIVIGITYSAYMIVFKSYALFNHKHEDMAVLLNLDHLLKRDFEQAETIEKDASGITLKWNDKLIKYEFQPDFIVRNNTRIDTFKVKMQDLILSFENAPVTEMQETAEQNRIDGLSFLLIYQDTKIPCHYLKTYSSTNLIQRNPNAVN